MTERPRRSRRGPHPVGVAGVTLATFAGVAALLAWQMSAGRDPALGAGRAAAGAPAPPAVVRRIVRRTIIERRVQRVVVILPRRAPRAAPAAAPAPAPVTTQPS